MNTIIAENNTTAPTGLKLTATAEDFVWLADFATAGLPEFTAFAFLDTTLGVQVIVDERLDPAVRNATVTTALERLFENRAKRFVLLDARGELFGGAA